MWTFILGFFAGIICFLFIVYLVLFNAFGQIVPKPPFIDPFQPLHIPKELNFFLRSHKEGKFEEESCLSFSLFLHFLFQEHKDTRRFRRWVYKKLQLELNDVTTRSAASRIIQGIQIRDLSLGSESPVIKNIRVERFKMSKNCDLFDEILFEVDVDYSGGFETSVDVLKLAGKARIIVSRQPFAHWCFAFIEMPQLDFKIDSQFQGRQLKHVIPLFTTAFRKAFQRKHVWPNYKIRYRPLLPNPLLHPAPLISSFDHIQINGTGLEVTVLQCTRLNVKLCQDTHTDVYCTISLDVRPFLSDLREDTIHCISVMLTFTRKGASDSIGLVFAKPGTLLRKVVKVSKIEANSTAEKCGFKIGDVLLAINSVPIRSDKQALRMLSGTAGDLLVLVERDLNFYFEDEIDDLSNVANFHDDKFICINDKNDEKHSEFPNSSKEESDCKTDLCINAFSNVDVLLDNKYKSDDDRSIRDCSPFININNCTFSSLSVNSSCEPFLPVESISFKNKFMPQHSEIMTEKSLDSIPKKCICKKHCGRNKNDDLTKNKSKLLRARSTRIPKLSVQAPSSALLRSRSDSFLFDEANLTSVISSSTLGNAVKNLFNSVCESLNSTAPGGLGDNFEESKSSNEYDDFVESTLLKDGFGVNAFNDDLYDDALFINDNMSSHTKTEKLLDEKTTNMCSQNVDGSKAYSKRERFQARANEVASKIHAGRAKFNDLIWSRSKAKDNNNSLLTSRTSVYLANIPSSTPDSKTTECAKDPATVFLKTSDFKFVDDMKDTKIQSESPTHENHVVDKSKKKRIMKIKKSPVPSTSNLCEDLSFKKQCFLNSSVLNDQHDSLNTSSTSSLINLRRTKSVALTENPLWGQSLHFGLNQRSTKYLNVMVHSINNLSLPSNFPSSPTEEIREMEALKESSIPTLLGYTSVYIPQIVEDCQLTLANCHREVFHFRSPTTDNSELLAEFPELSRRTGFDARLCFGDITLGFRFFPQGLPDSLIRVTTPSHVTCKTRARTFDSQQEIIAEPINSQTLQNSLLKNNDKEDESVGFISGDQNLSQNSSHNWTSIHFKNGFSYPCGICRGKIWLKWASHCTTCNFVCHNKCVEKANTQHECVVNTHFDDKSNFVILEDKDFVEAGFQFPAKETITLQSSVPTRRRRLANTVSEKLTTTWKHVESAAASRRKTFVKQATNDYKPNFPISTTKLDSSNSTLVSSSFQPEDSDLMELPENMTASKLRLIESLEKFTTMHSAKNQLKKKNKYTAEVFKTKIVTIDKILGADFMSSLNGSTNLRNLNFEPGNAYNPDVIRDVKSAGQHVFNNITNLIDRKLQINKQIDNIQLEIDRLSQIQRHFITTVSSSASQKSEQKLNTAYNANLVSPSTITDETIKSINVHREALALLMIHYCSGLEDCVEKEDEILKKANTDDVGSKAEAKGSDRFFNKTNQLYNDSSQTLSLFDEYTVEEDCSEKNKFAALTKTSTKPNFFSNF